MAYLPAVLPMPEFLWIAFPYIQVFDDVLAQKKRKALRPSSFY